VERKETTYYLSFEIVSEKNERFANQSERGKIYFIILIAA
jgi:hypothetical protein